MTTIVSCFITGINNIKYRDTNQYLEFGIKLIECNVPKIIYIEPQFIDIIKDYNKETTLLIPFEKKDLYFNKYKNEITDFSVNTNNTDKDTLDYMLLQNNKPEFLQKAIELNHFHTNQYVWVDFGIFHMIQNSKEKFMDYIYKLQYKPYEKIRISSCINPLYNEYHKDIYKDVAWYFAGSVLGGSTQSLTIFSEKCREKIKKVIQEKKSLMWEINIWYLVFLENKELFNLYMCNHNDSILENY